MGSPGINTGSSSVMDWSPGEPATPSGGRNTNAATDIGQGPNNGTPRSRSRSRFVTEHGAMQLPVNMGGMEVYKEVIF